MENKNKKIIKKIIKIGIVVGAVAIYLYGPQEAKMLVIGATSITFSQYLTKKSKKTKA